MTAYYIFFLAIFSFIALGAVTQRSETGLVLLRATIVCIALFAGLRDIVGIDTAGYHRVFSAIFLGYGDWTEWLVFEPLFTAYMLGFKALIDDPHLFMLSIAAIQGLILYGICQRHTHMWLFLFIYISGFYLQNQFNIIRAGLGGLLLAYAYLLKQQGASNYLPLTCMALTHYSTLLAAPIIIEHRSRIIGLLVVALITVVFVGTGGVERITYKLTGYFLDSEFQKSGQLRFSPILVLTILLAAMAQYKIFKRSASTEHAIFAVMIFFKIAQMAYPILWRLHDLLYFLWLTAASYHLGPRPNLEKKFLLIALALINLWYSSYYMLLYEQQNLIQRDAKFGGVNADALDSPMVPYRSFLDR